jgi:GDP/UDP-N,N'-diacetylbacillosamine 2-epimerase (hydrolysing)
MRKRKICVITGTRAEYGLLYWLLKAIDTDSSLNLQLVVTGMHLCSEFGLTYKEIEKEFLITKKVEMLLASDTPVGISKSMGLAQIGFAEVYEDLKPDIVVVLGDRFEIFAAASAAMVACIPLAHIHGGEATQGLIDEPIRHSITKMSHLHFCATQEYKNRIVQLGENPKSVFNVGGLGIESIKRLPLYSKKELEKALGFPFAKKNLLVTFHPVSLEKSSAAKDFQQLLDALETLQDTHIIFTKANSDTDGRIINTMMEDFVASHPHTTALFASLGQLRYLSTLQYVDAVVGNSSSGLLEAPSFHIGTINIGNRQAGRIKARSVIDVPPQKDAILKAFDKLYSDTFQKQLKEVQNPYGEGFASQKILAILQSANLENILQKKFYDIEVQK